MSDPDFDRVETLFHEAVELPATERSAFLDKACGGDPKLRAALDELLRRDAAGGSRLASPVEQEASRLRDQSTVLGDGRLGRAPAEPLPDVPGYELLGVLGRGGMGVVFKARQRSLGRLVALKMLPAGDVSPDHLARFRSEAVLLARLNQPNIVPIYDVGDYQGRPYFTMEFVDGPSLSRALGGHPTREDVAARLVEILARTVHGVHGSGIIHRDLKPGNVLLEGVPTPAAGTAAQPDPELLLNAVPRLTDFGLAKDLAAAKGLTRTGTAMGTPSYMAPEQARGRGAEVGPATDVYALGAILYELLVGRAPFDAGSPAETMSQVLNDEPVSPRRLRPGLHRDAETVVMKCLEKSPRKRYATALDLAEDLRRLQAEEPIRARPVGSIERTVRWCRRQPMVAGLTALAAVLAIGLVTFFGLYSRELKRALDREAEYTASLQQIAAERQERIIQLNIHIGEDQLRSGDAAAALLRFVEALRAENGSTGREAVHRKNIAAALSACPRLEQHQCHDGTVLCAEAGNDGAHVVVTSPDQHVDIREAHTGRVKGARFPVGGSLRLGALSPDGRWLAAAGPGGAAVWDARDGGRHPLPVDAASVTALAFHADLPVLVSQHSDSTARFWDLASGRPVAMPGPGPAKVVSLGEKGRWLVTRRPDGTRELWDVAAGRAVTTLPPLPEDGPTTVSGDGRHVAVADAAGGVRRWDVVAAKWADTAARPQRAIRHVLVSPDGRRLGTVGDDGSLHVWPADGGPTAATVSQSRTARAQFTPDGARLITDDDTGDVRILDAATGRPVTAVLHHGAPLAAAFLTPDARRLTTIGRDGTVRVWDLTKCHTADRLTVTDLLALARLLSGHQIHDDGQVKPLPPERQRECWKRVREAGG